MQITPTSFPCVKHIPIPLDPAFPIHAPYIGRLHYSPNKPPATYMHYHDSTELGICQCGAGIFYIGSQVFPFSAGDVSVIAPGTVHIAHSDGQETAGWQFVDVDLPHLLRDVPQEAKAAAARFNGMLYHGQDVGVANLMKRLLQELSMNRPYARQAIRQMVGLVGIDLARLVDEAKSEPAPPSQGLHEISAAIVYISQNYSSDFTIEELAALCNRSVTSFRRAFVAATGLTPFSYLYEIRIKTAINLMRGSSMHISEISERVGYQTLSSFNRHFKAITGLTPSEMREQNFK